jgi:hypothetical protein
MNAARKELEPLPPARILDCTAEEYHKDPCETPSLSSSTAKKLMADSPLHAWTGHPRFGDEETDEDEVAAEDEPTKAKDNGTMIHRLLLGKGAEIVIVEANDFKSKAAREARDEAKAAGKLPIIAHKYDSMLETAEHLRRRLKSYGYDLTGQSEVPIEWFERGIHGPVRCRSMLDHVFINDGVIYDLKTIRSANPKHIGRTWIEKGYDIQAICYPRALEALRPELAGRVEIEFLFAEIKPPYAVVPGSPDGELLQVGELRWGKAVRIWEDCLAKGVWPSYTTSRITFEAPPYQIVEHLGNWSA